MHVTFCFKYYSCSFFPSVHVLPSGDIDNQPSIANAQGPAGVVECTSSTIIDQHQYPETDDPLTEVYNIKRSWYSCSYTLHSSQCQQWLMSH